jgi:mRNA-degrading endonuclease HigB of HigAB toxin-antitoxin module
MSRYLAKGDARPTAGAACHESGLLTSIDYDAAIVEVLDVLTHAEYDKALWKDRY